MDIIILLGIILVAVAVQFIVEGLKSPVSAVIKYLGKEDKVNPLIAPFLSILWAVGLCILAGCDLFTAFGYPLLYPYVGNVATGIIASLGAAKVYELITSMQDYRDKLAVERKE